MGAMTSGAPESVAVAISSYGEKFGVAFQLSDDLLDIASESEASGKTPGTDLREGIRTLPVLLALRGTSVEDSRLRDLLAGPLTDDNLHAEALGLLRSSPAMVEARTELVSWAESARAELEALPAGPVTDALSQMCDVVVDRST
jgi:heptaprenyl diphosphate synthase